MKTNRKDAHMTPERLKIKETYDNIKEALEAANEKMDSTVERLRQKEESIPRNSPVPFWLSKK